MDKLNLSNDLSNKKLFSYSDNNIAILKNIKDIYNEFPESGLIETFMICIVTKGSSRITLDNEQFDFNKYDILISKPNFVIEKSMMSFDFDCIGLFISIDYAEKVTINLNIPLNLIFNSNHYEICKCTEEEKNRFVNIINLIQEKLVAEDTINKQNSIAMLFLSMIYDLFDVRTRKIETKEKSNYSSSELILQNFAAMLGDKSQPYLNVNGYAEKLCISAKYFSSICKKHIGKTASQIITEEIVRDAKLQLKSTKKNIQQISFDMGFANQSHFGVFFHRHTGMSPQAFRNKELMKFNN